MASRMAYQREHSKRIQRFEAIQRIRKCVPSLSQSKSTMHPPANNCYTKLQRAAATENHQTLRDTCDLSFLCFLMWYTSPAIIYGANFECVSVANRCKLGNGLFRNFPYSKQESIGENNDTLCCVFLKVVVGILAVCGTCSSIILIRLIGKRRLFLISMAGVFSSMFALGKCNYTEEFNFEK